VASYGPLNSSRYGQRYGSHFDTDAASLLSPPAEAAAWGRLLEERFGFPVPWAAAYAAHLLRQTWGSQ
jgi:hypothetical protein